MISTRAASQCSNDRIHRAELTDGIEVMEWSVACCPTGLSVNKAHNVFVAYCKDISAGNQFSVHMRIAMDQHVLLAIVRKEHHLAHQTQRTLSELIVPISR